MNIKYHVCNNNYNSTNNNSNIVQFSSRTYHPQTLQSVALRRACHFPAMLVLCYFLKLHSTQLFAFLNPLLSFTRVWTSPETGTRACSDRSTRRLRVRNLLFPSLPSHTLAQSHRENSSLSMSHTSELMQEKDNLREGMRKVEEPCSLTSLLPVNYV